jgi:uncharacterized phage-associated protein
MRPYDSKVIADWFVRRAKRDGRTLTNMQLQKLVYFAHGWSLALLHGPLVTSRVEAWEWGPVLPDLYRDLARWGAGPVEGPLLAFDEPLESEEEELLEAVYQAYGTRTAAQLSALTHAKGTPWAVNYRSGVRGIRIPNGDMESYFGERAHLVN